MGVPSACSSTPVARQIISCATFIPCQLAPVLLLEYLLVCNGGGCLQGEGRGHCQAPDGLRLPRTHHELAGAWDSHD